MRTFLSGVVVLALLLEAFTGYVLYRWCEDVAQGEQSVKVREAKVSARESTVVGNETAIASRMAELHGRSIALDTLKSRLDGQERDNGLKGRALDDKERALKAQKDDDDEEHANQAFALGLVRAYFDRVRDSVNRPSADDEFWASDRDSPTKPSNSAPDAPNSRKKQFEELEARYARIEKSQPQETIEIAGRAAALSEMAAACADSVARDSVESFAFEAAIEVDVEMLRDIAHKLDLPDDVIPRNRYELLDSDRLAEHESLQVRKIAYLKQKDSTFSGLYQLAIAHEEAVLDQIREAKGKRPLDPTAQFAKAILEKRLTSDEIASIRAATTESARAAAIEHRHAQLLAKSLAIDWTNLALRERSDAAQQSLRPELRVRFRGAETRLAVLDYLTTSNPKDPISLKKNLQELRNNPATVAEAVRQFIENRYSDPLKAAELGVLLEKTYAASHGTIVTSEDRRSFKRWCADHLSPGQAYELGFLRLKSTLDCFAEIAAVNDPRAPYPDAVEDVRDDREEFVKSLLERPNELKPHEARFESPLVAKVADSQEMYNALRILATRVGTPELNSAFIAKALDGLAEQLNAIDRARQNVERAAGKNAQQLAKLQRLGKSVSVPPEIQTARSAIALSYKAIELRLAEIGTDNPARRAQELLVRAKSGLDAIPPPHGDLSNVSAAADWADPKIVARTEKDVVESLKKVDASTSQAIADVARIELAEKSPIIKDVDRPTDSRLVEGLFNKSRKSKIPPEFRSVFKTDAAWEEFVHKNPWAAQYEHDSGSSFENGLGEFGSKPGYGSSATESTYAELLKKYGYETKPGASGFKSEWNYEPKPSTPWHERPTYKPPEYKPPAYKPPAYKPPAYRPPPVRGR